MPLYHPESKFTPPRPDCPHPEYWHAEDDQATELEVTNLVAAFVGALQPDYVIETGTWLGHTSHAIGKALQENGHGRLNAIELNETKAIAANQRCAGLPVTVYHMDSLAFEPTEPIDFAWFDSLPAIRPLEFLHYYPWMHDRTVVGFHDTGPQHPTRQLLEEHVIDQELLQPLDLPTPRGVTFGRVLGK